MSIETEGKVLGNSLRAFGVNEDWVDFISTNLKGVALKFQVYGRVVVSDIWHVLDPRDLFCDNICMLHGNQWGGNPNEIGDISGPGPGAVDDTLGLDCAERCDHAVHCVRAESGRTSGDVGHRTIF